MKTLSNITRAERDELNALSKDVYGASSRWQKLIKLGYAKLVTEETTELVPGKDETEEATTRKVQVPVLTSYGAKQSQMTYHTVDSIRTEMLERKVKLDEYRAVIKKMQDEARAKKEQEKLASTVHEELSGTAV